MLSNAVRSRIFLLVALFAVPVQALSAVADYGVDLDVGIIYTDNLFLFQDGLEQSDFVYLISPNFYYFRDDESLKANVRYKPEALFYSEHSDNNNVFHILDANLTATLARDRFYVFLQAANFQTIVTPNGQFPTTNIPVSNNRIDSRIFEVRPFWTEKIGSADMLLEVAYRASDYDDDTFQSSNERSAFFRLDNVRQEQGLTWGLEYRFRGLEYEDAIPWDFQRALAELGYWVSRVARVFAVVGAETSFENLLESNLDESFWEGGIQFKPNQRVNIVLAYGQRSYGDSYRADISVVSRRTEVSFSYSDGPESRANLAFDRDPIVGDDNLDTALDRPGRSDRFIRRRAEFRAALKSAKTETSLRVFAEERILRTTADGMPLGDESYAGVAFRWEWRAGAKSTVGIGADFVERIDEIINDDITRVQLDYAYRISQRTSLRAELANTRQRGNDSSEFDFVENQARLFLRIKF